MLFNAQLLLFALHENGPCSFRAMILDLGIQHLFPIIVHLGRMVLEVLVLIASEQGLVSKCSVNPATGPTIDP